VLLVLSSASIIFHVTEVTDYTLGGREALRKMLFPSVVRAVFFCQCIGPRAFSLFFLPFLVFFSAFWGAIWGFIARHFESF
jgi:hypothetical protein